MRCKRVLRSFENHAGVDIDEVERVGRKVMHREGTGSEGVVTVTCAVLVQLFTKMRGGDLGGLVQWSHLYCHSTGGNGREFGHD